MNLSQQPPANTSTYPGEAEIIGRFHTGSEEGLEMVFNRCYTGLLYFTLQFVKDRDMAEDIVADGFVELWEKRDDFESLAAIKSFLYNTIRNTCLDLPGPPHFSTRHGKFHIYKPINAVEQLGDHRVIKAELIQRIWDGIAQWPPLRREVFRMSFVDGLNCFEIAGALGVSVDSVRVQKAKAMHTLRGIFKEEDQQKAW